jgi:hypothetical protein
MSGKIQILRVEQDGDGLIVTFSDGTTAGYVVEELLELRPHREPVEKAKGKNHPQIVATRFHDAAPSRSLTRKRPAPKS